MCKFVLCASFVEGCAADTGLFADVMNEFPKDNELLVCIDSPDGQVMKAYREIADRDSNNLIGSWLYCMVNRSALSFENLDVALTTDRLKFVELAMRLDGASPIIVWSKAAWKDATDLFPDLWIMDRLEGKKAVRRCAKGKGIGRMSKSKVGKGGVNIQGHVVNVGNVNSDHSSAIVSSSIDGAILELQEKIGAEASSEAKEQLRVLQTQLGASKPDKNIVERAWKKLVELAPDVTTVASAVAAINGILGHP